jgi:hypothetical protein
MDNLRTAAQQALDGYDQHDPLGVVKRPIYTYPPKRKPLAEDEISTLSREMVKGDKSVNWLCRAIEKAHDIGVEK